MPRTHYFSAFNHTLSQRASAMQAHVVDRVNGSVYVSHADDFVANREFLGFVLGGKFGLGG